jgi:hypothetical protein
VQNHNEKKEKLMAATAQKNERSDRRLDFHFMRYRIVAGPSGGAYKSVAYIGSERIATSEGDDARTASEVLKSELADRDAAMRARRIENVPLAEEYFEALAVVGLKDITRVEPALKYHAGVDGGVTTFQEMARALGVAQDSVVDGYFDLGRRIGRELEFSPTDSRISRRYEAILSIASAESDEHGKLIGVRLRTEFLEGLNVFEQKRNIFRL